MSSDKIKELLIVIFGGLFGIHKFIKGDTKMGVIYLFTVGLFGIGWIVDIVKVLIDIPLNGRSSLMGSEGIRTINEGKIPNIQGTNLNLLGNFDLNLVETFKKIIINKNLIENTEYIPTIINFIYFKTFCF